MVLHTKEHDCVLDIQNDISLQLACILTLEKSYNYIHMAALYFCKCKRPFRRHEAFESSMTEHQTSSSF